MCYWVNKLFTKNVHSMILGWFGDQKKYGGGSLYLDTIPNLFCFFVVTSPKADVLTGVTLSAVWPNDKNRTKLSRAWHHLSQLSKGANCSRANCMRIQLSKGANHSRANCMRCQLSRGANRTEPTVQCQTFRGQMFSANRSGANHSSANGGGSFQKCLYILSQDSYRGGRYLYW